MLLSSLGVGGNVLVNLVGFGMWVCVFDWFGLVFMSMLPFFGLYQTKCLVSSIGVFATI